MRTSELQFNIIYTPGTARYLSPFILTLLRWSDCRFRLVANGCSKEEATLLENVTALDQRLELLVMPQDHMAPHGETLDFLHERTDSDYFCFMDSDILATGPFLEDMHSDMQGADLFSSALPLWHNETDITIPKHFRHMHGIHAYTHDGKTIACDYFVIYNNKAFTEARDATGTGLKVTGWQELSDDNQAAIRELGQQRSDYDSGKALTLLMLTRGAKVAFRQSDQLKHIGGFTEAGVSSGDLLYSRGKFDKLVHRLPSLPGRLLNGLTDAFYVLTRRSGENDFSEDLSLASRIRRRTLTARYFYLLIVGLMDDKPLPSVPRLCDRTAEERLSNVSGEIAELIKQVRNEPGPWQD